MILMLASSVESWASTRDGAHNLLRGSNTSLHSFSSHNKIVLVVTAKRGMVVTAKRGGCLIHRAREMARVVDLMAYSLCPISSMKAGASMLRPGSVTCFNSSA